MPRLFQGQLLKLALRAGLAAATTPTITTTTTPPPALTAPPVGIEALTDALERARRTAHDFRQRYEDAVRQVLVRVAREAPAAFLEHVNDHLTAAGDEEAPAHPGWPPPSVDELVPAEILREQLQAATDPIRKRAAPAWIAVFQRDIPGISFSLSSPFFGAVIEGSAQHIVGIAETTRTELRALLARAYEDGMSVTATSELIRSALTSTGTTRATAIARTELARIANGSAVAGVSVVSNATGERYLKRWLVAPGSEHPRHESYLGLSGQVRPLEKPFDVGGFAADYPGDANLPPGESISCRCTVVFEQARSGEK
jgi:hypothetical protein